MLTVTVGAPVRVDPSGADHPLELRLAGAVDLGAAERLHQWLEAGQRLADGVIVDLAEVDFIDSAGLRVLLAASQRPGTLTLQNVSRSLQLSFDMGGLAHLLPVPA